MHTETQARDLWCPMVRHEGSSGTFNRGWSPANPLNLASAQAQQASYLCNCIASRCAAWRWHDQPDPVSRPCADPRTTQRPAYPADLPPGWLFVPALPSCGLPAHWLPGPQSLPATGYCGLLSGPPGLRD